MARPPSANAVRQRVKFWLEDPSVLIRHWELWPTSTMCEAQRLNVFTLLVIIIAVILKFMGSKDWWLFLVGGLVVIVVIWFSIANRYIEPPLVENYRCPSRNVAAKSSRSTDERSEERVKRNVGHPVTLRFCGKRR